MSVPMPKAVLRFWDILVQEIRLQLQESAKMDGTGLYLKKEPLISGKIIFLINSNMGQLPETQKEPLTEQKLRCERFFFIKCQFLPSDKPPVFHHPR